MKTILKAILFVVLLPVRILATILVVAVAIPPCLICGVVRPSTVKYGVAIFGFTGWYLLPRIWGKKVSLQGLQAQELTASQ